jgi:hypothetical protein
LKSDLQPSQHDSSSSNPDVVVTEHSCTEFLILLGRKDIHVEVRDGRLVVNAPAGVLDATLRTELKRRKEEVLTLLTVPKNPIAQLVAVPRGGRIPMTPSQQGMWLIDHFDPGNVAYNIPAAIVLDAPLDLARMQRAVDWLLARHEILRTAFHQEDGELFQTIEDSACMVVGFTDLSSLPEREAGRKLRTLIREHARRPFDLSQPPLLRFHCFRVRSNHDILFFNIHHILADQQSLYVIRDELLACYQVLLQGETPEMPALTLQYADYASWFAREMRGDRIASQVQYWKEKLAALPPFLVLPTRRAYPEQRTAWGSTIRFDVPAEASEALIRVGREEGATAFMTFLTVYGLMLARFSGGDDFCIGSPLSQRRHIETRRMIGLFVNMVPYRLRLTGEQTFRELLKEVRTTALEAFEQGDVPFQTLVRELRFNRRSPRSPIFQVMFAFEQFVPVNFDGVPVDTEPGTARYDLSLTLLETGAGNVLGVFEYRTDLFEAAEIQALVDEFLSLVAAIARDPEGVFFPAPPIEAAKADEVARDSTSVELERLRRPLLGRLSRMFASRTRD